MNDLSMEERVYLIKCFYSKGEVYVNAYREFRSKYGTYRICSDNTLKRIIDKFMQYGKLQDRRYDAPGPACKVTTLETYNTVAKFFKENPEASIRSAASKLGISKTSMHRIMQRFPKQTYFETVRMGK